MDLILNAFGLSPTEVVTEKIGSGHIHQTFRITESKKEKAYILQRVNKNVFRNPEVISSNLRLAADYLGKRYPRYNFLRSIPAINGDELVYDEDGFPWRLFPYQQNTITIDKVEHEEEAFRAAEGFGQLTNYLDKIPTEKFRETIPKFHDLSLRYDQFKKALSQASDDRRQKAGKLIDVCQKQNFLVKTYNELIGSGALRLRITHNDTKINNILFDRNSGEVVSVIDLDTLMPGYFIYDFGDMVRTFVSPVSEEEQDYSKIVFRTEIYDALLKGYLSQTKHILSEDEKRAIPFAGKMMTYIMALRFLADYLNGDTYYHTNYPDQNLIRAGNQLSFLGILENSI